MKKWNVTLSTTEPDNYVGIINVRQGNVNSEVMEAQIVQNGLPLDLTDCTATFQAFLGGEHVVERSCKIIDYKKGIVQYTFDEYTMQSLHRQKANIAFTKERKRLRPLKILLILSFMLYLKLRGDGVLLANCRGLD